MEGKSSNQSVHFLPDFCRLVLSNVRRLIGQFMNVRFDLPKQKSNFAKQKAFFRRRFQWVPSDLFFSKKMDCGSHNFLNVFSENIDVDNTVCNCTSRVNFAGNVIKFLVENLDNSLIATYKVATGFPDIKGRNVSHCCDEYVFSGLYSILRPENPFPWFYQILQFHLFWQFLNSICSSVAFNFGQQTLFPPDKTE